MNTSIFTPVQVTDSLYSKNVASTERETYVSLKDAYGSKLAARLTKSYISDQKVFDANFAFLSTTLSKLHEKPVEPKAFVTYLQDVPVNYGGGFVDYVEYFEVNWAGIMNEFRNVEGNNSNYIPRVNAGLNQKKVDVYTFEVAYDLRFVELEKMKKLALQKAIESIYKDAIVAGFDFFCQKVAYKGIHGKTGLFNSDNVTITAIDNSSATTANKGFIGMTDDNIVSFFNGIFEYYLLNSNMNGAVLPDTILVPTFVGKLLTSRHNDLYTSTLRKFILEHNLGMDEGDENFKVRISSRPDLDTLGTGGHGRIVAYRKNEDFVRMDIPYEMRQFITLPNIDRMSYTTAFVGQVSEVQMPYNTSNTELGIVTYWDFAK